MSAITTPLLPRLAAPEKLVLRRRRSLRWLSKAPAPTEVGTSTTRPGGTVLARQGSPVEQVLVVIAGRVNGTSLGPDGSRVDWVAGPGAVIGYTDFEARGVFASTVTAADDVSLLAYTPNMYRAAARG